MMLRVRVTIILYISNDGKEGRGDFCGANPVWLLVMISLVFILYKFITIYDYLCLPLLQ